MSTLWSNRYIAIRHDNILTRSLIWGKYSRSKVQEIAMD